MRNLQDVIDMRPGSIYAAFGSKEGLFKEALQHYKDSGLATLAKCREESVSPISALRLFMNKLIVDTQDGAPNSICMLAKTVAELTSDNQELLNETIAAMNEVEKAFEALIIEAQSLGEVDPAKDSSRLASHVQIQISGLRTYAKTHPGAQNLNSMIDEVFAYHPF